MVYVDKIITALLIFPLIAGLFSLPYALYQYHKYGAVSKYRTLVVFSSILYMLIAYFQVILPLPSLESTIGNRWLDHLNLIPFRQIWTYWHDKAFTIKEFINYLKSFSLWQLLFNVLLTLPFGIYLRYYFKQSFKRTVLYTFLLSLFFEFTQLSALYGIYPGPYRLADVEDLLCNTLGGMIGYQIGYVFALVLPKWEEIDEYCRNVGKTVTGKRRFWAVLFDYICSIILYLIIRGIVLLFIPEVPSISINEWIYNWSFFCIFSLIQILLTKGFTLGHAICRTILVSNDGTKASKGKLIMRYLYLWMFTELPLLILDLSLNWNFLYNNDSLVLILLFVSRFYFLYYFYNEVIRKNPKLMPHDRLSKTAYMSSDISKWI